MVFLAGTFSSSASLKALNNDRQRQLQHVLGFTLNIVVLTNLLQFMHGKCRRAGRFASFCLVLAATPLLLLDMARCVVMDAGFGWVEAPGGLYGPDMRGEVDGKFTGVGRLCVGSTWLGFFLLMAGVFKHVA